MMTPNYRPFVSATGTSTTRGIGAWPETGNTVERDWTRNSVRILGVNAVVAVVKERPDPNFGKVTWNGSSFAN